MDVGCLCLIEFDNLFVFVVCKWVYGLRVTGNYMWIVLCVRALMCVFVFECVLCLNVVFVLMKKRYQ